MFVEAREICGALAVVTALVMAGCSPSDSGTGGGGRSMSDMADQEDARTAARKQEESRVAAEKQAAKEAAARAAAEAQPEVREVTARSGKRGQSLQGGGYLSVVTGTRFWAENQMTLNMIQKNLSLYNAEHGYYPKTHEEFMKKIIEEGLIDLPELPDGWEYLYDPDEPLVLKMKNTGTGQENAVQ